MAFEELYPFTRILDTNGDGTGSVDAAQNFSVTPGVFYIQPRSGAIYQISRITVVIADSRVDREDRYGDIAGGVTNGVGVYVANDAISIQINQQLNPQTNIDWLSYGSSVFNPFGSGNPNVLQIDWPLPTELGLNGIRLEGINNERLEVRLSDNFNGLDVHRFSVAGLADIAL